MHMLKIVRELERRGEPKLAALLRAATREEGAAALILFLIIAVFLLGATALALLMEHLNPSAEAKLRRILSKAKQQGWRPGKPLPKSLAQEVRALADEIPAAKLITIKRLLMKELSAKQLRRMRLMITKEELGMEELHTRRRRLEIEEERLRRERREELLKRRSL